MLSLRDLISLLLSIASIGICLLGVVLTWEYRYLWASWLMIGGVLGIVLATEISE